MTNAAQLPTIDTPSRLDAAVNAAMLGASPCPECGAANESLGPVVGLTPTGEVFDATTSKTIMTGEPTGRLAVCCNECAYIGDDADTLDDAVRLWHEEPRP
jgi:hypothetical protein